MTWNDLVRKVWGPCTDKEAHDLLWECTAFPFAGKAHIKEQLQYIKDKSGGIFDKAMAIADTETRIAMEGAC